MKKKLLVDDVVLNEISFSLEQMKLFDNQPEKQLYYFSAIYGIIQKALHYNYNDDLIFLYININIVYQYFSDRMKALKMGDTVLPITKEDFDKLITCTNDLLNDLKNAKDYVTSLKKMAKIAYSTQGNGHYLREKGDLKL